MDAQASVRLDLPACDIEAKTIAQDGLKVSLTIVRPEGSKAISPSIHLCAWRRLDSWRLPDPRAIRT